MWFSLVLSGMILLQQGAAAPNGNPSKGNAAGESRKASDPVMAQPAAPAPVAESQAVITIPGLCGESSTKGGPAGACRTVITRGDFEKLMNALNPAGQEISQTGRQNFAQAYVEALAFADAAQKAGLDGSEAFRQVLYWARLRTIADLYRRKLQEESRNPSPEEIDAYYQENLASFEKVQLLRILAPRESAAAGDKSEFDKKALAAAQAARARAVKGDDPEQIQKDVYAGLGLEHPPGASIGSFRRADLMEKEAAEVFSLKPGEVSQVQVELKSYVIYKVAAKETLKEAQVKTEIAREIAQKKYRDALKSVMNAAPAEFNEQYFGTMPLKPSIDPPIPPRLAH